jgi:hypothetical protein
MAATDSMALLPGVLGSVSGCGAAARCGALPPKARATLARLMCTGGLSSQYSHSSARSSMLRWSMYRKVQPVAVAMQA